MKLQQESSSSFSGTQFRILIVGDPPELQAITKRSYISRVRHLNPSLHHSLFNILTMDSVFDFMIQRLRRPRNLNSKQARDYGVENYLQLLKATVHKDIVWKEPSTRFVFESPTNPDRQYALTYLDIKNFDAGVKHWKSLFHNLNKGVPGKIDRALARTAFKHHLSQIITNPHSRLRQRLNIQFDKQHYVKLQPQMKANACNGAPWPEQEAKLHRQCFDKPPSIQKEVECKELNKNYNYSLVKVEMASDKFNNSPGYKTNTLRPSIVTNKMTMGNLDRIGVNKRPRSASLQVLYDKVQSSIADGVGARWNGNKRLKVSATTPGSNKENDNFSQLSAKKHFGEDLAIRFKAGFEPTDEQEGLMSTPPQHSSKYVQDLYIINNHIPSRYQSSIPGKHVSPTRISNNMPINPISRLITRCSISTQSLNNSLDDNGARTLTPLENNSTSYPTHDCLNLLERYLGGQGALGVFGG